MAGGHCAWIDERIAAGESAVMTCSALRRAYRDRLLASRPEARMVFLLADRETLASHLTGRHGHFSRGTSWTASWPIWRSRKAKNSYRGEPDRKPGSNGREDNE